LFVNPISDIAVLGPPDNQSEPQHYDEYAAMLDKIRPLALRAAFPRGRAWLLRLDGSKWFPCDVERFEDGPIWITHSEEILGGMSGSPILADDGSAIGVVCTGTNRTTDSGPIDSGPNPALSRDLPAWLSREIGLTRRPLR
jgi:hypothetical protein